MCILLSSNIFLIFQRTNMKITGSAQMYKLFLLYYIALQLATAAKGRKLHELIIFRIKLSSYVNLKRLNKSIKTYNTRKCCYMYLGVVMDSFYFSFLLLKIYAFTSCLSVSKILLNYNY